MAVAATACSSDPGRGTSSEDAAADSTPPAEEGGDAASSTPVSDADARAETEVTPALDATQETETDATSDATEDTDALDSVNAPDAMEAGPTMTIGSPCTLDAENDPAFDGFQLGEVDIESSPGAPVCLAYHFQGRTSCPYGQNTMVQDSGAPGCMTPGGAPVVGNVAPHCLDRRSSAVVVWSCRCANAQGATNDGAEYCACPSSAPCTQAIASIGDAGGGATGAYCLPTIAAYNPNTACSQRCDPTAHPCD
jgi:hypothetical protein